MKPDEWKSEGEVPERTALDWAREHGETDQVLANLAQCVRRRRRRHLSRLAAGCAMLVALAAIWPMWRAGTPSDPTSVPEHASVVVSRPETRTLPDGTEVVLRPGAEIVTHFTSSVRRVVLDQGQAHFQVTKDLQRPFVVEAGGVEVRAVGTAFSVELGAGAVEVLVTEGRVAVEGSAGRSPDLARVADTLSAPDQDGRVFGAGKRVVVGRGRAGEPSAAEVAELSVSELSERLAWRVPRLEFAGTPLVQALAMFRTHGGVRITLADPALGRLQLSGVLRADNTESLLRLLDAEFGLVADQSSGEWVLRRR